jgi:hypothetical protein
MYTGLPDGIFSYQKSQFLYILEVLEAEYFGIFMANWSFGMF